MVEFLLAAGATVQDHHHRQAAAAARGDFTWTNTTPADHQQCAALIEKTKQ